MDSSLSPQGARADAEKTAVARSAGRQKTTQSSMSLAFGQLSVHALGRQTDYQRTVSNFPLASAKRAANWMKGRSRFRIDILQGLEGVVSSGEMLLVLGNPGSGCTTMLKALAGVTYDFDVNPESMLNYQGLSSKQLTSEFRGKVTYQAEADIHFPTLTMRETLTFASKARRLPTQWDGCRDAAEREAETLGLTEALDTKMGNSLIPGVSGGERKRTSIAEILVGNSALQCWDNSTRGLDSANALQFVTTLRRRTTESGSVAIVTLYQAGEDIYNLFDKVTVLHHGRQIYFGPAADAKQYFTDLGFIVPTRSTTPEFLTSVTRPVSLRPRMTDNAAVCPRSAADFVQLWQRSRHHQALVEEIDEYNRVYPPGTQQSLVAMRANMAAKSRSPYVLPLARQIALCIGRAFLRLRHNLAVPISAISGNAVLSIILGSMFYNMPNDTNSVFGRGVLLFFTSLVNTTLAAFESVALWDDRPIIEKHVQFGFYRAFAEAIASVIADFPNKLAITFVFNFPLYFLSNLRRTPGAFFTYYLFGLMCLLNGSVIYRSMGAISRTLAGSQPPGAIFVMLLTVYSGFVVPFRDMRPWLKWFSYINPVYYAFESMVINEFSGREFDCTSFIPADPASGDPFVCDGAGARPGATTISGDDYIEAAFGFHKADLWRNLGILIGIFAVFAFVYFVATEFVTMIPPRSDVLLYQQGHMPPVSHRDDEEALPDSRTSTESGKSEEIIQSEGIDTGDRATLLWTSLSYGIKDGKAEKRILKSLDGWVTPGQLTALMGPSGAGKTTLLNVLAERTSVGIITGDKIVDTKYENVAFARKIGYAQQEDTHLPTASVKETLTFSALLRQPPHYSKQEKLDYVDHVIHLLDMESYQHAVVERLNVEQRKRVTIGTELAARPELLLFLDEPTSGLDSDSAWVFCTLLRRLTDSGQAILCTIHQPSGPLLALFDRLIFLNEGHLVYFGSLGAEFSTLIPYFEGYGARKCLSHENPAEWLMEVTNRNSGINWPDIWHNSAESRAIRAECSRMAQRLVKPADKPEALQPRTQETEFATSFGYQLFVVGKRAFQHDWRSPEYLYSKALTTFGCAFVNGVSFWASGYTSQDSQNQIFSLFLLTQIFGSHVQLIMERFYHSRNLYETRERQTRTYSWTVFLTANIAVEFVSQTAMSVIAYLAWYYPLGMWRKALQLGQLDSRSGLIFLLVWSMLILFQTLSQMLMAIMPDIPTGINIANLLYMLSLIFSGVIATPQSLPGFWLFMWRATPLSYYISAIMSTGIAGTTIICSAKDVLTLDPPSGQTCGAYLTGTVPRILNPNATSGCQVCEYTTADSLLSVFSIYYKDRWWQWGVTVVYNVINVVLIFVLYRLIRVPRGAKKQAQDAVDTPIEEIKAGSKE
ncbi:ABC transporter [Coniella lustricola]|uniref:ABC transporter n=1 Tax=Coniella lustricola TaxID=2025994 RepID=A0A2T3AA17_9PEZI|nr:ABC transporter [Coniella lustricola]